MFDVHDYFKHRLSTVVQDRQCNKLSTKIVQTGYSFKGQAKEKVWPNPLNPLIAEAEKLGGPIVSYAALRDMCDLVLGRSSKKNRFLDSAEYKAEVSRVVRDTTFYFGIIWGIPVQNAWGVMSYRSIYVSDALRKNVLQSERNYSYVTMDKVKVIQLSFYYPEGDPYLRLKRLLEIRKEMELYKNV